MTPNTCYDRLYDNMKNRLTVVDSKSEYTLGEYMQKKASIKKSEAQLQTVQSGVLSKSEQAASMLVSFVADKLTVKETPAKDKTIRSFPFRASAAAFLSAVVACSFMLCFGLIGAKLLSSTVASDSIIAEAEVEAEYDSEEAKADK